MLTGGKVEISLCFPLIRCNYDDYSILLYIYKVIWKHLYKVESQMDKGTLYQLRNLINRRNVGNNPFKDVNAHEDFFLLIVDSHILAAAMEMLGMGSLDDEPCSEILPPDVWVHDKDERRKALYNVASVIVDSFVDLTVTFDKKRPSNQDKVHAYACEVLSLGLLYKELQDAVREGDGLRVLRCWRYLLPIFRASKRTNYSIEVFNFLAQHQFVLSPRASQQLLWSRFVNTHGLPGKNIACDMHMEHLNRVLKGAIAGLGANKLQLPSPV